MTGDGVSRDANGCRSTGRGVVIENWGSGVPAGLSLVRKKAVTVLELERESVCVYV